MGSLLGDKPTEGFCITRRPYECLSPRPLSSVLLSLVLALLLAACHRGPDDGKPALQGVPAAASSTAQNGKSAFALATSVSWGRTGSAPIWRSSATGSPTFTSGSISG